MGRKGAQLNHSSAVGVPTRLGDQMPDIPPFGLLATLCQGLGLSEDLSPTARLGSVQGMLGEEKIYSTPWGREHRGPR